MIFMRTFVERLWRLLLIIVIVLLLLLLTLSSLARRWRLWLLLIIAWIRYKIIHRTMRWKSIRFRIPMSIIISSAIISIIISTIWSSWIIVIVPLLMLIIWILWMLTCLMVSIVLLRRHRLWMTFGIMWWNIFRCVTWWIRRCTSCSTRTTVIVVIEPDYHRCRKFEVIFKWN